MKKQPKVLVVDDQPINVKLLQRKLEREGMEVQVAYSGFECMESVKKDPPDLLLLDVMMPDMDGIEVCRRLKEMPSTVQIPVIFITAKSTKEGKLEGLNVGAADYITKPIDLEETLARVRTQLRIQDIHRENLDLQERLANARQSAAVGAITQGIAHNLNNLLGVIVGYLDLIKSGYDSKPDMVKRSTMLMEQAIKRMVNIVRQLSSIASSERPPLNWIALGPLIEGCIERFEEDFGLASCIEVDLVTPDARIPANQEVFENVISKLLINGWESYKKDIEDKRVKLTAEVTDPKTNTATLVIEVTDRGSGIDASVKDTMFEPFCTTKSSVGRGMGLTIARHTVRNMGGDLIVSAREGGGVSAKVTLPVKELKRLVDQPSATSKQTADT